MVAIAVGHARPADYLELTKPRIVVLVMITVAAGFYLGSGGAVTGLALFHTLLATALVAGGTNALNQVMERDVDARMRRTRGRPLPTGRLTIGEAALFAWALGVGGIAYMALFVNAVASAIATATLVSYVFAYTPLKRRTSLATLVGAVPGALPIVGGWAAATGGLDFEAGVLFAIVFLWQLPHFLALSWVYRDDYARAGLKMLSVADDGASTFRQAVLYAVAMLPVTLAPSVLGLAGPWYFFGALALTFWLIATAVSAARDRSIQRARRLFTATVLWLPAVLALMVLDKGV